MHAHTNVMYVYMIFLSRRYGDQGMTEPAFSACTTIEAKESYYRGNRDLL